VLSAADDSGVLQGVPRDPTGWQVYSVADELLALLGVCLAVVALAVGSVRVKVVVLLFCGLAVAFVLHALSAPPTNGVLFAGAPRRAATSGAGETVALVSLGVAVAGLGLSLVRR
jgi:hypothetical protein